MVAKKPQRRNFNNKKIPTPDKTNAPSSTADRAMLKTSLQAAAAFFNKSTPKNKKTSKKSAATPSHSTSPTPAAAEPLIATNETSQLNLTITSPPLPRNQPLTTHISLSSSADPVEFVPESPVPTPQPSLHPILGSGEIVIGVNGAAREKDVVMHDGITSYQRDSSDEVHIDSTNSAMQS